MKSYSDFEIDMLFEQVFELYPNKDRPAAAKKAFSVALRTGANHDNILKAVKIYALESRGDEYLYRFVNFINEDHWKDFVDMHKDPDAYIKSLQDEEKLAMKVVKSWCKVCRPHWCKPVEPIAKLPMALHALKNPQFRDRWIEGLTIAKEIFRHKLPDNDYRSKIILSFRWFCTVSTDKHTVLKLVEGEYGKPKPKNRFKPLSVERVTDKNPDDKENVESAMDAINKLLDELK